MRIFALGLFLALTVGTTSAWPADRQPFRPPATIIFEELGADPSVCSESKADRFENHVAVRCATTTESFKSIKKRWRKAVRGGSLSKFVQSDGASWNKAGTTARRTFVFQYGIPVEIMMDETERVLTVSWPESFPRCHVGYELTWFAKTEDVHSHGSKKTVHPDYPEQARIQRTGGTVMGSLLLDENGRVADVCVIGVYPQNVGFEEASLDSYARSMFEPATREGRPIAIATHFVQTYSLMPEGSYVSVLLKNYFDSVRASDDSGR